MRWFGLAAVALVAALALVACSGGDSAAPAQGADASAATAPTTAGTTPAVEADEPEAGSTEAAGDDTDGVREVTAAKPKVYWIHTEW